MSFRFGSYLACIVALTVVVAAQKGQYNYDSAQPSPSGAFTSSPSAVVGDASFVDGRMCAGVVVKDHNDTFIFGASKSGFAIDACDAETVANWEACCWLERAGVSKALFESDCLVAVHNMMDAEFEVD
ncbi:hypothetical protein BUALT_Bualt02G0155800 [Buddleja alternifolia]|uniref:RNase H type-1 domain-containing protein n=1 Tax=Buddleja alternifolia TaxID=168488 RepID=A0AAV6Y0J3_9LAMI|nr:hypothetical protein BUALT_Bualt02G0155800 [Buddleja alternifolia]